MGISRSIARFAPATVKFLLTALSEHTPFARRFVAQAPLSAVDGGDGGDFTVSIGDAGPTSKGVVQLAGQLGGTASAPDVRGVRITGGDGGEGPQLLALGAVKTGEALVRSGSTIVSLPVLSTGGGTMTADLAMGGHKIVGLSSGTATDDAATYGQLTSMLNGLDWQASVLRADLNAVPTSPAPSAGDRFLVAAGASGSPWGGHVGEIAVFNGGSSWTFIAPTKGTTVHVDGGASGGTDLTFDGINWVNIGVSVDHNATLNRSAADAHSQYQLGSERDANNGYAGLDGGGIVNKPVKAVRTASPDPGSPNPGDVWVNGADLRFRNNGGGGAQTETVERQANRDANNGYAGLDGGGIVNKPVKAVRTASPDPGSPNPGDVWVNGVDLRFRNNNGGGAQTETVERQANRDANNGYAGLDGGGVVNKPVKAVRIASPDPGSPNPGDVWVNGVDLKFRDAGGSPATRTLVATVRQVAPGTGLAGGGDLSADRTLSIASFTGLVSKDAMPAGGTSYASGITVLSDASVDVGPDGLLVPMHIRLPPAVDNTKLNMEVVLVFADNSSVMLVNTDNGSPADFDVLGLADTMMGGLASSASNSGKRLRKIVSQVHNITGNPFTASVAAFRVRAYALPAGAGSPL
jgi:hypothetical protein